MKPSSNYQEKIKRYLDLREDTKIRSLLDKAQRDSELTQQLQQSRVQGNSNQGVKNA